MTAAMGQRSAEPVGGRPRMNWLQRHVRPEQIRELSLLVLIVVADRDLRLVDRRLL